MAPFPGLVRCHPAEIGTHHPGRGHRLLQFVPGQVSGVKAKTDKPIVVGLAGEAALFFKFLLIIVEFSIAMVLFVCVQPKSTIFNIHADGEEFPVSLCVPTWRNRHPP